MPHGRKKTSSKNTQVDSAALTWDTIDIKKVRDVSWCSLDFIDTEIKKTFSGSEKGAQFIQKQVQLSESNRKASSTHHGLALVCGDMKAERVFFENRSHLIFKTVDGFDISRESLKKYKPKKGITFRPKLVDCNYLKLPKDYYTIAVACHGAHHVYNLGNFFYQTNKALKDGGVMHLYEWIGPNRLQIPKINHMIASFLLLALFSRKERTTHMGNIKGRWVQAEPDTWEPSEACNSVELMPQFLKYFEPIVMVPHGGLLYPIFEGIAQNLDERDSWTLFRIKLVYYLEKILTMLKVVEPLFVVAVGRKKQGVF